VSRYRWVILGAGTFAQTSFAALVVGLAAFAPFLRSEYHLSLGQTGVVLAAVSIGILPTVLPWGLLADRFGERAVMAIGLAGAGVVFLAIPATHGFAWLVGLLVLAGALGSSINAASGRAVMGWFGAEQRGLALGIRQTAVPIGGAVSAAVLPWIASSGGTRDAFFALGGFCIAAAAVAVALMREAPGAGRSQLGDVARTFRSSDNWVLAGGSGLFVTAQIALTNYPVLFLHEHRGLSTHSAALVLATMNVFGIGARIGSGRWSDRVRSRVRPLRTLGALITTGTALVAILVDAPLAALLPVLVVAGVLSLSWNGLAFTAAAETAGLAQSGAALGFQQTVLGIIVAVATPAFAALVGATSWRVAFAVAAFCPLVGVLALRRLPASTASGRSRETSVIPPAIP
jgi:sugar phosphate permease